MEDQGDVSEFTSVLGGPGYDNLSSAAMALFPSLILSSFSDFDWWLGRECVY